jgi:hypothetical protein
MSESYVNQLSQFRNEIEKLERDYEQFCSQHARPKSSPGNPPLPGGRDSAKQTSAILLLSRLNGLGGLQDRFWQGMVSHGSEGSQISQDWEATRQQLDSLATNMKQVLFPIVEVSKDKILWRWEIYSGDSSKLLVNFQELIDRKQVLPEGDFKSQARSSWLRAQKLQESCSGAGGSVHYWSKVTGVTESEVYTSVAYQRPSWNG